MYTRFFFFKAKLQKTILGRRNNFSNRQAKNSWMLVCQNTYKLCLLVQVLHLFSPRTMEAKAGIARVQVKPGLHSEFRVRCVRRLSQEEKRQV